MTKYRKKPVVIEAVQYTGRNTDEILEFTEMTAIINIGTEPYDENMHYNFITIETLEGDMRADVGDWIIKGVQSEFYPIKPDIFKETYEPVE